VSVAPSLRKVYWIAVLLGSWFVLSGSSCGNPPPTPEPNPTPTPDGEGAIKIIDGDFSPPLGLGCDLCCDNPLTAFYDEGLEDGWSALNTAALDRVHAAGCKHTVLRLGPFSDVGLAYLDVAEASVQHAEDLGMVSLISVWDSWAAANGWEFYGHGCSVTHGPPPQVLIDYAKQVGARFGKYKHVIFELSNEGFRCNPAPEFEQGMRDALASTFPDGPRLIGSQFYPGTVPSVVSRVTHGVGVSQSVRAARDAGAEGGAAPAGQIIFRPKPGTRSATGYGDRPRHPSKQGVRPVQISLAAQAARPVFDFVLYGGVPIGTDPPLAPPGTPAIIEEDDGNYSSTDAWRRFNERKAARVTMKHWRGGRAWWEEEDFLRHPLTIPGLIDCQTPPTGSETCKLKGEPGFVTHYAGDIDASITEALVQHPELYRWSADQAYVDTSLNEMLHLQYVTEGLRRRGYCSGSYHGEEIAVMLPADRSLNENYDLLRSDGLVRFSAHAATCNPGTIVGGASDAVNGPFSSSPVPPTPSPDPQPTPTPSPATPTPPVAGCPPEAPPTNKIKIEGRRLASLIIDLTPMAHDAAFCTPINARLDCPYGAETPEGMVQRQACEMERGPYTGFRGGVQCSKADDGVAPCWNNNGNPLQFRMRGPASTMAIFKVCAGNPWTGCWEADCSFDSPVCQ